MAEKIAPHQDVPFEVRSDSYNTFITSLRGALAGDKPDMIGPKDSKVKRPVLAKQTAPDKQPPRWIHVVVRDKETGGAPRVAIRSDDAYIMGFSTSEGKWFQFSKTGTKYKLVATDAVMAGFDSNYNTLVKHGLDGLPGLNLDMYSIATAAATLWNHKLKSKDTNALKNAVATLAVALCEAARFTPVSTVINDDWNTGWAAITEAEVSYIKEWGDLSTALLTWKKDNYKDPKNELFKKFAGIGINNGDQALAVVQLVKLVSRGKSLLAWLRYFWGLLVKKLQQDTTDYEKPKSSAMVNPL